MKFLPAVVFMLLLGGAGGMWAEEAPRKAMVAVRVNPTAPKIDGVLDDEAWQHAPRFGGFTQRIPNEGQPATDSTTVQFAYDDKSLYVAIMCYDKEPDKIAAGLTRRDQFPYSADWVHLSIDSNLDRQTAYSFFLTTAGALVDGYYYNDDQQDRTWDGVWDGRAHIGDQGWGAEFKIPFSILRFSPQEENIMGLNVDRYTTHTRENVFWAFILEKEKGWVSRFGDLRGIKGISPPKSREILPYAVARSTFEPQNSANPNGRDSFTNLGVDMRYGLASNISLNATINPDFGQVEADPAVLNLSVFETFYEERRPFFVEGGQLFQTPFQLFYSRRVGRQPGRLGLPAGYEETNRPESTSILGAVKLTGKSAGKTSFGLIEAVTGEEHATGESVGLGVHRFLVEPRTNYLVGRLQQDLFRGNSNVGVLATAVNRANSGAAYTGGMDWNLFWHNNMYQVSGQVVGSRAEDFGSIRSGYATQAELGKPSGLVQGNIRYEALSPGFDINDLGFVSRVGTQALQAWLGPRQYQPFGPFRERDLDINVNIGWNYDRLVYQKEISISPDLELKNYWWIWGGVTHKFQTLDDLDTRGGPPIEKPASTSAWFGVGSDSRKSVGGDFSVDWERNAEGSTWRSVSLQIEARPSTQVEFSLQPRYTRNNNDAQWVANVDDNGDGTQDHFVYGELESQVFEVTGRCSWVFTRDLTLQLYLQPFVAVGDYGKYKELARPKSYAFTPYPGLSFNPDFRRRSLRSNLVLRWEDLPGSTLFLVWSQARQDRAANPELQPWGNLRRSFADEGSNLFLVKLSYWMNI
ncbi:MAG: carbohydrate binding family 9 domain-containing protein [Candidatus Latescibacteria bacterium]|nr:carbohydrate binding family 9 domain-containing protein [Candidatus Latescibacterota bacterium]